MARSPTSASSLGGPEPSASIVGPPSSPASAQGVLAALLCKGSTPLFENCGSSGNSFDVSAFASLKDASGANEVAEGGGGGGLGVVGCSGGAMVVGLGSTLIRSS